MRNILFRAKQHEEFGNNFKVGKWLYGAVTSLQQDCAIFVTDGSSHFFSPDTVGQFTGFLDDNGVRIFEDDIIDVFIEENKETGEPSSNERYHVYWNQAKGAWMLEDIIQNYDNEISLGDMFFAHDESEKEYFHIIVIGNVFDNPELATNKK